MIWSENSNEDELAVTIFNLNKDEIANVNDVSKELGFVARKIMKKWKL